MMHLNVTRTNACLATTRASTGNLNQVVVEIDKVSDFSNQITAAAAQQQAGHRGNQSQYQSDILVLSR
ncbi:hypothetical protein Q7I37_10745 [Aeromonas allosaccharophila]